MPPQTVDFIVSTLRLGDATSAHTFALVDVLRKHGMTVRIIHNHPNGPVPPEIQALAQQAEYADYRPSADVTILQYPLWFPLAERFRQAPHAAIFWYHGVTPPELWGDHPGRELLQLSQTRTDLAWHAHIAASASPFTAHELYSQSGIPQERTRVVPLTLDVDGLAQPPEATRLDTLRRELGVGDRRVLLYVGRMAGNKRVDLLIRSLACLERSDVCLLVVGDTTLDAMTRDLHAGYLALARDLGVADQVIFTGRVPEVAPYLHLADVCLLPSRHEGFGVPVAEGMAAGKPVIAAHAGALPWVLGAGTGEPAGLLFVPDDVDDLTRQVRRVLDDSALAAELVERGRRRVREFDAAHFEHNVLSVVEEAWQASLHGPTLVTPASPLAGRADVALRDYTVRSHLPWFGPLIVWLRRNLTSHLKEPYLDRIVERQVDYNRMLAQEIGDLQAELAQLRAQIAALRNQSPGNPQEPTS